MQFELLVTVWKGTCYTVLLHTVLKVKRSRNRSVSLGLTILWATCLNIFHFVCASTSYISFCYPLSSRSLMNKFLQCWGNHDLKSDHLTILSIFLEVAKTGYSDLHHCFACFLELFPVLSVTVGCPHTIFLSHPVPNGSWLLKLRRTAVLSPVLYWLHRNYCSLVTKNDLTYKFSFQPALNSCVCYIFLSDLRWTNSC